MARPKEVSDSEILTVARRRLLRCGTGIPISAIAEELGVSHATIFNRFGSKEELLIAALGPTQRPPWIATLADGPDERPFRTQLEEIAAEVSSYFSGLAEGLTLLHGAGVPKERVFDGCGSTHASQAIEELQGWFRRARDRGLIGPCNVPALTATMLGALRSWSFNAAMLNEDTSGEAADSYISMLIDLLWNGIAP